MDVIEQPKKNKKLLIFLVVAVVIIAIITAVAVKFAVEHTAKEEVKKPSSTITAMPKLAEVKAEANKFCQSTWEDDTNNACPKAYVAAHQGQVIACDQTDKDIASRCASGYQEGYAKRTERLKELSSQQREKAKKPSKSKKSSFLPNFSFFDTAHAETAPTTTEADAVAQQAVTAKAKDFCQSIKDLKSSTDQSTCVAAYISAYNGQPALPGCSASVACQQGQKNGEADRNEDAKREKEYYEISSTEESDKNNSYTTGYNAAGTGVNANQVCSNDPYPTECEKGFNDGGGHFTSTAIENCKKDSNCADLVAKCEAKYKDTVTGPKCLQLVAAQYQKALEGYGSGLPAGEQALCDSAAGIECNNEFVTGAAEAGLTFAGAAFLASVGYQDAVNIEQLTILACGKTNGSGGSDPSCESGFKAGIKGKSRPSFCNISCENGYWLGKSIFSNKEVPEASPNAVTQKRLDTIAKSVCGSLDRGSVCYKALKEGFYGRPMPDGCKGNGACEHAYAAGQEIYSDPNLRSCITKTEKEAKSYLECVHELTEQCIIQTAKNFEDCNPAPSFATEIGETYYSSAGGDTSAPAPSPDLTQKAAAACLTLKAKNQSNCVAGYLAGYQGKKQPSSCDESCKNGRTEGNKTRAQEKFDSLPADVRAAAIYECRTTAGMTCKLAYAAAWSGFDYYCSGGDCDTGKSAGETAQINSKKTPEIEAKANKACAGPKYGPDINCVKGYVAAYTGGAEPYKCDSECKKGFEKGSLEAAEGPKSTAETPTSGGLQPSTIQ